MISLYQKHSVSACLIPLVLGWLWLAGCGSTLSIPVLEMEPQPIQAESAPVELPAPPKPVPDFERYLSFAIRQYHANQFRVAEFYLKRSLILEPENPQARNLLPWTYFFEKRYPRAQLAFEKAHTENPDDPRPLIGIGWCYFGMRDYYRALEKFEQALKLDPESRQAKKGLGFVHWMLGHSDQAETWLRQVYRWGQWDQLRRDWETWKERMPEQMIDVAPSDWQGQSLFTLNIEQPRFASLLFTYPDGAVHPAVDAAWRLYHKNLYDRALKAFQSLPSNAAETLDARNGLAWTLLQTGDLPAAQKAFNELKETYPGFPGVARGLKMVEEAFQEKARFALYYLDIGKYQIAANHIDELNKTYPKWSLPYSMRGWVHLKRGEEQRALRAFNTAMELDPRDSKALEGLRRFKDMELSKVFQADKALAEGDYKRASYLYHEYIRKHETGGVTPLLARAYSGMGFSQYHKGQYELALYNFRKLDGIPEFEFERNKGMGLAYYALGRYDQAVDHLIVADSLRSDQPDIIYKLDWAVLRSWNADTAREYLLAKTQDKPLRPTPYLGLGWVYYKTGRPNLGIEYFLKSIDLDPDIIQTVEFREMLESERFGWQVYNKLGWEYYHRDEADKAMRLFALALNRRPRSSEAMQGLGYSLVKLQQYARAELILKKAIKRNPNTHPVEVSVMGAEPGTRVDYWTSARTQLARALYAQGRYEEALKWFLNEFERHPDWTEVHDGLGWTYLKLGRLAESRQAFLRSIGLQPLNPYSHKGLRKVKIQMARNQR